VLRVLGIDPGSRVCGYGMITIGPRDAVACAECGVLTAPADRPMERRLGEIARGLREVIDELAPEAIALEAVFAQVNVKTALALAQARGMALAIAGLVGLPVFSYAPALVKRTVVGTGRAGKDQVVRMVAGMLGLRTLPSPDAADALAIALTHARLCRSSPARLVASVVVAGPEPNRSSLGPRLREDRDRPAARVPPAGGGRS
jgi:crossover junction endodeoxyribonuclease RuvC